MSHILTIGDKTIEVFHTAANKDMHMMINNMHDPEICPECIRPGTLTDNPAVITDVHVPPGALNNDDLGKIFDSVTNKKPVLEKGDVVAFKNFNIPQKFIVSQVTPVATGWNIQLQAVKDE